MKRRTAFSTCLHLAVASAIGWTFGVQINGSEQKTTLMFKQTSRNTQLVEKCSTFLPRYQPLIFCHSLLQVIFHEYVSKDPAI